MIGSNNDSICRTISNTLSGLSSLYFRKNWLTGKAEKSVSALEIEIDGPEWAEPRLFVVIAESEARICTYKCSDVNCSRT